MRYRILDPSEWSKLHAIADPRTIPHPDAASAAVAEDEEGNVLGVLFLQIALHMEPLVLKSPHVRFDKLHQTLYDAVKSDKGLHFYVFSDKEIISRMAEHVGMKLLPYTIYEQEVT